MINRLSIVSILLIAGCANSNMSDAGRYKDRVFPALPENTARLVVLHRSTVCGMFTDDIDISLDGQVIGELAGDSFISIDIPAGAHSLEASAFLHTGDIPARMIDAGQTYYVMAGYPETGVNNYGVAHAGKVYAPLIGCSGAFGLHGIEERRALRMLPDYWDASRSE